METLHKAALAAGYAMATPDDEPPSPVAIQPIPDPTTLPAIPSFRQRSMAREAMAVAADWIKVHLPLTGGRAPA